MQRFNPLRAIQILALILSSVGLTGCPDESPNNPGGNGESPTGTILYGSPAGSVYRYDFDAGKATLLFDGGEPDHLPNGDILYVHYDFYKGDEITIANAAGTSKRPVLKYGATVSYALPKASPDGNAISFTYYPRGFTHVLDANDGTVILDLNGNIVMRIDSLFDGDWTPDGGMVLAGTLAVSTGSPTDTPWQEGLYLVDPDFTQATRIDPNLTRPMQPAVSPDGKRVAFIMNDHVWAMDIDGTNLQQLTTGTKQESYPAWSPDGNWIAVNSYGTFETTFFQVMAVVPSSASTPADLTNESTYWPLADEFTSSSTLGRLNSSHTMSWK